MSLIVILPSDSSGDHERGLLVCDRAAEGVRLPHRRRLRPRGLRRSHRLPEVLCTQREQGR